MSMFKNLEKSIEAFHYIEKNLLTIDTIYKSSNIKSKKLYNLIHELGASSTVSTIDLTKQLSDEARNLACQGKTYDEIIKEINKKQYIKELFGL